MILSKDVERKMRYGVDKADFYDNGFEVEVTLGSRGYFSAVLSNQGEIVGNFFEEDVHRLTRKINGGIKDARHFKSRNRVTNCERLRSNLDEKGRVARASTQEYAESKQEAVGDPQAENAINWS